MAPDSIIIFVTCPSRKAASSIAGSLLKKRIVACVNIISSVRSLFRWKGRIEEARELLLVMKTSRKNFRKAELEVKRLHPYEVPEIVAVNISAGSRDFLGWIGESVK